MSIGFPCSSVTIRLGRTLDALYPHLEAIWLAGVERALLKDVDLTLIFYDLTAFIAPGRDAESDIVDFGVAHNTPMGKRKSKLGLNVATDGNIPWLYRFWSGRTADQATVAPNMAALAAWLQKRGDSLAETLVVGDRAMRNDELALAYDQYGLRYLAGLRALKKEHKALLRPWTTEQFTDFPLEAGDNPQYGGRGCTVTFEHEGRPVNHKGWVILAGPIRDQRRPEPAGPPGGAGAGAHQAQGKRGQPYYRTVKRIRRSAHARCRESKGGPLMSVQVKETTDGALDLRWRIDPHVAYTPRELHFS